MGEESEGRGLMGEVRSGLMCAGPAGSWDSDSPLAFLTPDVKLHEGKKCHDGFKGAWKKAAQNCGMALAPFLT